MSDIDMALKVGSVVGLSRLATSGRGSGSVTNNYNYGNI